MTGAKWTISWCFATTVLWQTMHIGFDVILIGLLFLWQITKLAVSAKATLNEPMF